VSATLARRIERDEALHVVDLFRPHWNGQFHKICDNSGVVGVGRLYKFHFQNDFFRFVFLCVYIIVYNSACADCSQQFVAILLGANCP
jgi:hypothetical protein